MQTKLKTLVGSADQNMKRSVHCLHLNIESPQLLLIQYKCFLLL